MKIVDLSHTINAQTPVYPGDPAVVVEPAGQINNDGYNDHKLAFGTHVGTHIDAPNHMIADGKKLKDYPVERFVADAICIDAANGFDAIDSADINEAMAVLFYTGASEYFDQAKYWHEYKVLDEKSCQKLIDKKVSIVGVDTGSVDIEEDFPVHKLLLGNDILIIENLTNLEDLIDKKFELYALPLKLENDGAPARVVAVIK